MGGWRGVALACITAVLFAVLVPASCAVRVQVRPHDALNVRGRTSVLADTAIEDWLVSLRADDSEQATASTTDSETNIKCVYGIVTTDYGRGFGYSILLAIVLIAVSIAFVFLAGGILSIPFTLQGPVIAGALLPLVLDPIRKRFPVTSEYYGPGEAYVLGRSANYTQLAGIVLLSVVNKLVVFLFAHHVRQETTLAHDSYKQLKDGVQGFGPFVGRFLEVWIDCMPGHWGPCIQGSVGLRGEIGFWVAIFVAIAVTPVAYLIGIPRNFIGWEDASNPPECSGPESWSQQCGTCRFVSIGPYITLFVTVVFVFVVERIVHREDSEYHESARKWASIGSKVFVLIFNIVLIVLGIHAAISQETQFQKTSGLVNVVVSILQVGVTSMKLWNDPDIRTMRANRRNRMDLEK